MNVGALHLAIAFAMMLHACASPSQRADMTVDELRISAETKEFTVACSTVVGLWGTARVVYLNVDRVTNGFKGTVTIDPSSCAILMTNVPTLQTLIPSTEK